MKINKRAAAALVLGVGALGASAMYLQSLQPTGDVINAASGRLIPVSGYGADPVMNTSRVTAQQSSLATLTDSTGGARFDNTSVGSTPIMTATSATLRASGRSGVSESQVVSAATRVGKREPQAVSIAPTSDLVAGSTVLTRLGDASMTLEAQDAGDGSSERAGSAMPEMRSASSSTLLLTTLRPFDALPAASAQGWQWGAQMAPAASGANYAPSSKTPQAASAAPSAAPQPPTTLAAPDPAASTPPTVSILAIVPEPASLALLGFGLIGLALAQRRKA